MKKLLLFALVSVVLASCTSRTGHLTGSLGRRVYQPQIPLGMVYIPSGAYQMGENDGDVPFLHQTRPRTVSVQAFYMDQTCLVFKLNKTEIDLISLNAKSDKIDLIKLTSNKDKKY